MRNTHKRTHKNNRLRHIAADYQPLYLNAIEYDRNIKWEDDGGIDQLRTKIHHFIICKSNYGYHIMSFSSSGHSCSYSTEKYNVWIMFLFDILNFGIIRPQTERDVYGQ